MKQDEKVPARCRHLLAKIDPHKLAAALLREEPSLGARPRPARATT